ncbi:hypothetical protein Tco_1371544 [Tanacetum coccineum]
MLLSFRHFFEINELKAQLKAKNNSISKLKDHIDTLKGKGMSKGDKYANIPKVLAPGMYKLDLEPLSPMLLRNREAHVDYLKYTHEHVDTLHEIVEHARDLRPLDSDLDSAFGNLQVVQIVLWYLDLGRSMHMTENRSQLINFVSKFMGTVRFGNDHVAAIKGYEDYHIGNVMIS